jgi:hypothetical protein
MLRRAAALAAHPQDVDRIVGGALWRWLATQLAGLTGRPGLALVAAKTAADALRTEPEPLASDRSAALSESHELAPVS